MGTPPDRNDSSSEADKILSRVTRVLGSMERPDYGRVKVDTRRYVRLIIDLSASFWIRDISDTNEDLSSVLSLRLARPGLSEDYLLFVSNVGDYAFAMVVDESMPVSTDVLEMLANLLKGNGLEILSKDILSFPVKAMTFNSDQPKLFNVLFSDTEYLPWELPNRDPDEVPANDA